MQVSIFYSMYKLFRLLYNENDSAYNIEKIKSGGGDFYVGVNGHPDG